MNSSKWIDNFLEVVNLNRVYLNLNQFTATKIDTVYGENEFVQRERVA